MPTGRGDQASRDRRARLRGRRRAGGARAPTSASCSAATAPCCAPSAACSAPAVPTLGVNYGNVGFLAALPHDDWWTGLRGHARRPATASSTCSPWTCASTARLYTAVNDVILSRVAPRHVLHLEYRVSGVTVGRMLCDGLIVASPTGSTAYNLSCGGPVVEWDADVLVLNFIAPHSLGFRPVILRPDHEIIGAQRLARAGGRGRGRRRVGRRAWAAATRCTSWPGPQRASPHGARQGLVLSERRGEALRPPRCSLSCPSTTSC